MRGGDRLVFECSWMSGICFSFYHSTYCCGDFKRSPPLISLFCQSVPKCRLPKNPASPRGKPRTQKPLAATIQRSALLRELWVAKLATPTVGCAKLEAYTIQRTTPPQLRVRSAAPPKGAPRALRAECTIQQTAQLRKVSGGCYPPLQIACTANKKSHGLACSLVTGRVREPNYRHKFRASLKKEKIWIQSLKQRI